MADLLNAQARRPRQLKLRIATLPSGVESTVPIAERVQDVFCATTSGYGMSETWACVFDAAVVAYPDPRMAEVPVAFVILQAGECISADQLIARMKGRIASFKIPRHVIFVEAFPMTSSGKIRKFELRAEARGLLQDGAQAS